MTQDPDTGDQIPSHTAPPPHVPASTATHPPTEISLNNYRVNLHLKVAISAHNLAERHRPDKLIGYFHSNSIINRFRNYLCQEVLQPSFVQQAWLRPGFVYALCNLPEASGHSVLHRRSVWRECNLGNEVWSIAPHLHGGCEPAANRDSNKGPTSYS